MLVSRPLTIPKILGGEARGRKKVSPAIKWDSRAGRASPPTSEQAECEVEFT
jgi:hypothetical protein